MLTLNLYEKEKISEAKKNKEGQVARLGIEVKKLEEVLKKYHEKTIEERIKS